MMEDVICMWHDSEQFNVQKSKSVMKRFCLSYAVCQPVTESTPSLRLRCINSGSIRGIGVHTSRSFCGRYYRRRRRCILPSPISLRHRRQRLRLQSHTVQHEPATFLSSKCNETRQEWKHGVTEGRKTH